MEVLSINYLFESDESRSIGGRLEGLISISISAAESDDLRVRGSRKDRLLCRILIGDRGQMDDPNPVVLTVREVARLLRIQRPKVYELIRQHTIDGFKLGADWRIKRESVERLIGKIPDEFFTESGSFTLKNIKKDDKESAELLKPKTA